MKHKILFYICTLISVFFALASISDALFWSIPFHREINPYHVSAHPLSLLWYWSLVGLPVWMVISLFKKRFSIMIAMVTVLYTPLYFIWAAFIFPHTGIFPGLFVWLVLLVLVFLFEGVLFVQLKQKTVTPENTKRTPEKA